MAVSILLVDDDDSILSIFEIFLTSNGYEVSACNTAERALELLNKKNYDVTVLDFIRPEMRGDELALKIKKEQENIEIIFVSGFSQFEQCIKTLNVGISEILLKPITADELVSAVSRTINNGIKERFDSSMDIIVE